MPMHNLIEYSDVYWKTPGSLMQNDKHVPALDNNSNINFFFANNKSNILVKFKQQITGRTGNSGTKNVEIMVRLKCLSNFWRTLEMPLTNSEISFQLKWSKYCFLVAGTVAN